MQWQNIQVFQAITKCDTSSFYGFGKATALLKPIPSKSVTDLPFHFTYQEVPKEIL